MSVDACTPGFSSWQDPRWFFHCGEGTAFMGVVGAAELAAFPDARQELRSEAGAGGGLPRQWRAIWMLWTRTVSPPATSSCAALAPDTWRTWTSRSRGQAAAATPGSNRWRRHSGGPSSGAARQGCSRGGCGGGPGR
nr:CbrC family protein [Streptomyces rochei]